MNRLLSAPTFPLAPGLSRPGVVAWTPTAAGQAGALRRVCAAKGHMGGSSPK